MEEKRKETNIQNANREALEQTMEYLKQNNFYSLPEETEPEKPSMLERT